MSALLTGDPANALWFAFGTFFIASFAVLFMKTDYRRLKLDLMKVAVEDIGPVST